jgi:hypothetical protein
MTQFDKEYHPIIEDYISDYSEESLDSVEREAFEEVLVYDDDLRKLARSAKLGKALLRQYAEVKAKEGFEERLMARITEAN